MINNKAFSPSPCDSLVCQISFEKFEKKFLAAFQLKLDPSSLLCGDMTQKSDSV